MSLEERISDLEDIISGILDDGAIVAVFKCEVNDVPRYY